MQRIFILVILLILVIVIFALQNSSDVDVQLWFWQIESSLGLLLLISFSIGAILGMLISYPLIVKKNKLLRQRDRRVKELLEKIEMGSGEPPLRNEFEDLEKTD